MKKQDILQKKSIAYYSGLDGVEVKGIEYGIEDHVLCVSGAWYGKKQPHRLKVYYAGDERAYIRLYGYRLPLDEFIRMGD